MFDDSEFLGNSKMAGCDIGVPREFIMGEVKHTPHSWEVLQKHELPEGIDWRNKDGKNWLSWNKN